MKTKGDKKISDFEREERYRWRNRINVIKKVHDRREGKGIENGRQNYYKK